MAAYSARQLNNLEVLVEAYQHLAELEPESATLHHEFGVALNATGDSLSAVVAWEEAVRLDPSEARYQEALRWYSSLRHIVYRAPEHLRMGGVYEKLGGPEKAAEHYARFVDLWNECDLELRPLLDDVRARLARLRSDTED